MHQERDVRADGPGWESSGARGTGRLLVYTQAEAWNKRWTTSLCEHECFGDLFASPGWGCELYMAQRDAQQVAATAPEAARGVERDQSPERGALPPAQAEVKS